MNPITNPYQTNPVKRCEDTSHTGDNTDTKLYIRGDRIIRLCTDCITSGDEPLNKSSRFERRRVLPDHNRR